MNYVLSFLVFVLKTETIFASCKVSDFSVQSNFDIDKYVGVTWYEHSWLPEPDHPTETLSEDYQHTYYLHSDGKSITAFVNGRNPPDLTKCFYYKAKYLTTDVPGKWLRKHGQKTRDYWIINTDYVSFSVEYGCSIQHSVGECTVPNVWVWSRIPGQLPADKIALIDQTLERLCVNKSAFLETKQTNECSENKGCRIFSIDSRRQKNFDIEKYAGKWFEISWLPQFFIPADQLFQDYQHIYDLSSDGAFLTGFIRGRNPADLTKCFYNQGQLLPTSQPGKFIYRRNVSLSDIYETDYWVMSTDYVTYAVIYGCRELDSSGLCTYADSWIWSRTTVIPANKLYIIQSVQGTLCVNTSMYLTTEQNNECSLDRAMIDSLSEKRSFKDCTVPSIVQRKIQNFDHIKFTGKWYRHAYLFQKPVDPFTDEVLEIDPSASNGQTFTAQMRTRNRNGQRCIHEDLVIHQTDTPGMLKTTRKTKSGMEQTVSYVMALNYSSFYVAYACLEQDANSKCKQPRVSLWTRAPALTPETLTEVVRTIIGVCLDFDVFSKLKNTNECLRSTGITVTSGFLFVLWLVHFC